MAISENERDDAAVAVRLRAIYARQARNGFRVGQRVRVTEEHRRLFPKSKNASRCVAAFFARYRGARSV